MYRVGDYVYFDTTQNLPYAIRRIEELMKTSNGNVEAKVLCFFRRRDISQSLITLADKHNIALEEEQEEEADSLDDKQKHQLKHRELFFSRQIETLSATQIRGKCNVMLLNETDSFSSYLNKEDSFFYTLVYEPNQKTLLADRGEIRVGQKYQAEVPKRAEQPEYDSNRKIETLVFKPDQLSDAEIDQYITIVKSIGTFGRALDISSSVKQPNLLLTASTASRDITIQKALDVLHENDYDIGRAVLALTKNNVPTICRDQLEDWSPAEATLFEESLDKYSKSFFEIRKEVMDWKKMKNIVEYYYMWKTTDRYVQQKKLKATESESKLKQVYIPNYSNNKQTNNGVTSGAMPGDTPGKSCESCAKTQSSLWYPYGQPHSNTRLCQSCWTYYKKFGGLRYPSKPQAELVTDNKQNSTNGQTVNNNNSSNNSSNKISTSPSLKEPISDSTNTEEKEYKCKECNKTFTRQGNAHVVLNLMVKNKRNDDEGDEFSLCNDCLSSKSC